MAAGDRTPGVRITSGNGADFGPGSYGRIGDAWLCRPPRGPLGHLGRHTVTEHGDGTITVAPSILANPQPDDPEPGSGESWHGFLEAGIWREV
jgi:hypothetical protein